MHQLTVSSLNHRNAGSGSGHKGAATSKKKTKKWSWGIGVCSHLKSLGHWLWFVIHEDLSFKNEMKWNLYFCRSGGYYIHFLLMVGFCAWTKTTPVLWVSQKAIHPGTQNNFQCPVDLYGMEKVHCVCAYLQWDVFSLFIAFWIDMLTMVWFYLETDGAWNITQRTSLSTKKNITKHWFKSSIAAGRSTEKSLGIIDMWC